jgi:hypothetical protein
LQSHDHVADAAVGPRIANRLRLPSRLHQSGVAQPGEMLRQRRLAEPDNRFEFADGPFAVRELAKDDQPPIVGDRLQ